MAAVHTAGGEVSRRKPPPYIRPVVPLKWERKPPTNQDVPPTPVSSGLLSEKHNNESTLASTDTNVITEQTWGGAPEDLEKSSSSAQDTNKRRASRAPSEVGQTQVSKFKNDEEIPSHERRDVQGTTLSTSDSADRPLHHEDEKAHGSHLTRSESTGSDCLHQYKPDLNISSSNTLATDLTSNPSTHSEKAEEAMVGHSHPTPQLQTGAEMLVTDAGPSPESDIKQQHPPQNVTYLGSPSENGTNLSESIGMNSATSTQQTTPATPGVPEQLLGTRPMSSRLDTVEFIPASQSNFPQPTYYGPYYGSLPQSSNPYYSMPNFQLSSQYYSQNFPMYHQPSQANSIGGQPASAPTIESIDHGTFIPPSGFILTHLLQNFNVSHLADVKLQVIHEEDRFPKTTLYLHKLLVARSETLLDLINEYAGNFDDENNLLINLRLSTRFVTQTSLAAALRTCYGEPIANFIGSAAHGQYEGSKSQALDDMAESLGFVVAGHILKLEDVMLRGLEVAAIRLKWTNFEYAISFALESCDHRKQSSERTSIPLPDMPQPYGRSMDRFPETAFPRNTREFLSVCLRFICHFCPSSWVFDKSALPLPIVDRLPSIEKLERAPTVKTRFARIKFGARNSEEDETTDVNQLLSRVVLSLPFDVLDLLLQLDIDRGGPINGRLSEIVEERERRRKSIVENESIDWNQRRLAKDAEWNHVGYQEFIATNSKGGEYLSRAPTTIYRTTADRKMAEERENVGRGIKKTLRD